MGKQDKYAARLVIYHTYIGSNIHSKNILFFSGILHVVFSLMKNTTLTKMERLCVLLFDEMKIQSIYDYDKKNDTTLGPTKYVQVIMARGIFGNWKQPIFFIMTAK